MLLNKDGMNRIILIAVMLFTGVCSAYGGSEDSRSNKIEIDIEPQFGLEATLPGPLKSGNAGARAYNVGGGCHIGCMVNFHISEHLFISPGIFWFVNNFSMKEKWVNAIDSRVRSVWYSRNGIRIPLYVGYRWSFSSNKAFSLFTGPEFQCGIGGNETLHMDDVSVNNKIYSEEIGFRRCGENWIIGAKFDINRVTISASGGFGMINLVRIKDISLNENRVNIGVGYKF